MTRISQQYLEGIKEGRKIYTMAQREGYLSTGWLLDEIESLIRLRHKLAPLANTAIEIKFFDGQIAFYQQQANRAR